MTNVFGERLKQLRHERGWSQSQLAKAVGLTKQAISSYEINNITPSFDRLTLLADALHVSTDYLMGKSAERDIVGGGEDIYAELSHVLDVLSVTNNTPTFKGVPIKRSYLPAVRMVLKSNIDGIEQLIKELEDADLQK